MRTYRREGGQSAGRAWDLWQPHEYKAFSEARGDRRGQATALVTRWVGGDELNERCGAPNPAQGGLTDSLATANCACWTEPTPGFLERHRRLPENAGSRGNADRRRFPCHPRMTRSVQAPYAPDSEAFRDARRATRAHLVLVRHSISGSLALGPQVPHRLR